MHILLRHALTGLYYQSVGKWTSNAKRAHDFGILDEALRFAHKSASPNLEINISFDQPRKLDSFRLCELFA